jgi:hypothetical protein
MMRIPALFLPLLLVAACAPSLSWHKEGADAEELRQAQRLCTREAQDYGFALERIRPGDETAGNERGAGSATGAIYRTCMERKGWRRYRDQPKT